jgi:glutamate racemase
MKAQLGILDWGIGGISIYRLLKSRLGNVSIVYLSDTGATPYGKMSCPELVTRLNAVTRFLKSRGVTNLVLGCNAASTAIHLLNHDNLVIEGVIESAVKVAADMKPKRLGLIGGGRTVRSGVYRTALAERGIQVRQRVAQPLSGLIESGDVSSAGLRHECAKILEPLRDCSHILLACTHYPAIQPILKDFVAPATIFIDPAAELVNRISQWHLPVGGEDSFLTTGNPKSMQTAAFKAFGVRIDRVRQVTISNQ